MQTSFSTETETPDGAEEQSKRHMAISFVTSQLYRFFSSIFRENVMV